MKLFTAKLLLVAIERLQSNYSRFMSQLYKIVFPHRFAECGRDVYIYHPAHITGWRFMKVGNNVHINRNTFIRAEGGLIIGDNVHIGSNLVIYTINHNYIGNALPYDHTMIKKPVVIQKNVWLGINVTIIPGVTIGAGAIIGAGSVISKDVPPLAIVGAAPQRIIKYRNKDHYMDLENKRHYGGRSGYLYRME